MDRVKFYRQIICDFLREQGKIIPIGGIIESETIFDQECDRTQCATFSDRYLLLHMGWNEQQRIYSVVLHLELKEGKI